MSVLLPPVADERIQALRACMQRHHLDACVVPTADPHLSEYLPEHWQVRQWLTGFSGSAGILVVTRQFAGLWTDSRYWEQADASLGPRHITVMHAGKPGVLSPAQWLAEHLPESSRVWLYAPITSLQSQRDWQQALGETYQILGEPDLFSELWRERPALPRRAIYPHLPPFACRTVAQNITQLRKAMEQAQAQWHVLSSLDDIAWLFNLRGSDVPYNPVFLAHALIGQSSLELFIHEGKLDAKLKQAFEESGITIQAYDDWYHRLASLPAGQTVMLDPARITQASYSALSHLHCVEQINPSHCIKAQKNSQEIEQVRTSMEADGVALCEFFAWFESVLGKEEVTELTIDEKITAARAAQPDFVSPSFATIAGFKGNGAMPHYQATPDNYAVINESGLLLIDSGGQYLGGTTDITRVVSVGEPSPEQRHDFTLVLKGMIALSMACFPQGTTGHSLDTLARMPLWQQGLDFGHGTGHGVGYFLNVHEGPQSISPRNQAGKRYELKPGMIISNEPGLYRPGKWGIRIENLVLVVEAQTTEFGQFYCFETLTLCPIDTRCIEADLLTNAEKSWLNAYHQQVYQRLKNRVSGKALAWLEARTQAI